MINPCQLQYVRMVQDVDDRGTVISKEILRNDKDTVYPYKLRWVRFSANIIYRS
jgi:hypothetical protein